MRVRVRKLELFLGDCSARLPFGFGKALLRRAPLLLARASVECDGTLAHGHSEDLLVPKWFDKDPARTPRQDAEDLIASARRAADACEAAGEPLPVFELWWRVHNECVRGAQNGLRAGFGVALCERAVMDAACRAARVSLFEALKRDLFALEPARVYPALDGWEPARSLPAAPLTSVELRHTVGLADELRAAEIAPERRVADGCPQALDEYVRTHGLSLFKVKLSGERSRDVQRLLAIAEVLTECLGDRPARVTLDGNEQFASLTELAATLDAVASVPEGEGFLDGLLYVEQPLPRALSFEPNATADLGALRFAVILDEADDGVMAFPRAIERGYRGVSLKACKGVIKGLLHRGLCERVGGGLFQSAEDLTTLPVLPLQQDLALICAQGLPHAERNGHHYFRGLDHLPREEARAALAAHPDLYRERADGGVALRIEAGRLSTGSLACIGFGHAGAIRAEERTAVAEWAFPE